MSASRKPRNPVAPKGFTLPIIVRDNVTLLPFFVAVSLLNYVFQLLMARSLNPGQYAVMAASLSLVAILASPGAIIAILSTRIVSTYWASGSFYQLRRLLSRVWIWLALVATTISLLLVIPSGRMAQLLSIESTWATIWVAIAVAPALLAPLMAGMLQGSLSFGLFGAFTTIASGSRLLMGFAVVAFGLGAAGAVATHPLSGLLALFFGYLGWRWLIRGKSDDDRTSIKVQLPIRDHFKVAAIAVVQIVLFNLDILFVKALFEDRIAADYAAAMLIGRTVFYVAGPIVTVLLPNVIHSVTRREPYVGMFLFSATVVVGLCVVGVALVFWVPGALYGIVFADAYQPYQDVLRAYAISGSLLAVLQLLAAFHIGVSNLRVWIAMSVLLPLPVLSYGIFNATPGEIAWGMVGALTVYNLYMLAETGLFLANRHGKAGAQATPA